MDLYQVNRQTWNVLAPVYQEKFMDLVLYNQSYDEFCKALPQPGAKILEVGCGPGNISRYLLKQRPDFEFLGIDNAPNMVELAKTNVPSGRFMEMDARDISQLNTLFDGIISGFCLPYLAPEDAGKFLYDLHQLLNKNGLLYLSFVEGEGHTPVLQTNSSGISSYFTFYDRKFLMDELTSLGFGSMVCTDVPYTNAKEEIEIHTLLLARKLE